MKKYKCIDNGYSTDESPWIENAKTNILSRDTVIASGGRRAILRYIWTCQLSSSCVSA